MEYWVLSSLLTVGYAIYRYCFKGLDHFKKHGIRHIPPWPVLGNMSPVFLRQIAITELVKKVYNISPNAKYVGFFNVMNPVVVIRDLDLIKSISVKNFEAFHDHRSFIDEANDPILGKSLVSLRGDKWRDVRNVLSPAFTSSKMRTMFKLMSDYAADFADFLAKTPTNKNVIETKDCFTRYTNDVIATCAFGISVDSMRNPKNDFYVHGRKASSFSFSRMVKFYLVRNMPVISRMLGIKIVSKSMAKFFRDVVKSTINMRDTQNIVRPDMLQLMMDTRSTKGLGKELTIEDMTSQAFIFFFGGFDTTSTTMCFAAHEIAMNPNVQTKLRNEIDAAMKTANGVLTYEVVNGMRYLDAVINESLRMYPIGLFLDRMCTRDFELPPALPGDKPYLLKKGSTVWFPAYGLHHDPTYFPDPEKFNPERFLNEDKKDINPNAYIPFGMGPRMCIGNRFALLEIKVMLVHLLARCVLKRCEKTVYPMRFSKKGFNIAPDGGFWLKIEPRSDAPNVTSNATNGIATNG